MDRWTEFKLFVQTVDLPTYLLRKLPIVHANQIWALDTTYIPMAKGFVYLTTVADVSNRRVLTHKVAITTGPAVPGKSLSRPLPATAPPGLSTPITAASSQRRNSPTPSFPKAASCP